MKAKTGAELIAAERRRQIKGEKFGVIHDDAHTAGELAWAAACYAAGENIVVSSRAPSSWPFSLGWDKRKKHSRIRRLIIAGALCAAEIDRLQRLEARKHEHGHRR